MHRAVVGLRDNLISGARYDIINIAQTLVAVEPTGYERAQCTGRRYRRRARERHGQIQLVPPPPRCALDPAVREERGALGIPLVRSSRSVRGPFASGIEAAAVVLDDDPTGRLKLGHHTDQRRVRGLRMFVNPLARFSDCRLDAAAALVLDASNVHFHGNSCVL